jgi:hypothetical protein
MFEKEQQIIAEANEVISDIEKKSAVSAIDAVNLRSDMEYWQRQKTEAEERIANGDERIAA